jgi:hypothetical protein
LGAVVIVVARKIGLPDVVNVGLAALCIGDEQESRQGTNGWTCMPDVPGRVRDT